MTINAENCGHVVERKGKDCSTCRWVNVDPTDEPCLSCGIQIKYDHWEEKKDGVSINGVQKDLLLII